MSRFNSYIRGLQKDASMYDKQQAENMDKQFDSDATVTDGIVRWNSNGNVPPKDILEFWKYIGKDFDYEKTIEVSKKETAEFLEEYREARKNYKPSEEELYEMRAAFGEGVIVVDAITGKKIQL